MLAVCGGGGSDLAAWLIVAAALAVWVLVTALIVRAARDRTERRLLLGLLIGSIVVGPLIIAAFYQGVFGSDGNIGKLALVLLIPGAIGAGIAQLTEAADRLRAFVIGLWGAVFLGGAGVLLVFAFVAVGNGCIE
ncbi:MAG TPA: hypothetical protein VFK14_00625 [Solirubrobacterales bacterium]|nr:hypothetical protein [Solirubrobacterales bacterium]